MVGITRSKVIFFFRWRNLWDVLICFLFKTPRCFFKGPQNPIGFLVFHKARCSAVRCLGMLQPDVRAALLSEGISRPEYLGLAVWNKHSGLMKSWLVVSTHLKNISQIRSSPQVRVKIKNVWNHHLESCFTKINFPEIKGISLTQPPFGGGHRFVWGREPIGTETCYFSGLRRSVAS